MDLEHRAGLTAGGLTTKGTLQVIASPIVESPALAGVSGMGHILLSVGFLLLFLILGRRIRDTRDDGRVEPLVDHTPPPMLTA